jgi:predicted CXXCH cytochrome family protein
MRRLLPSVVVLACIALAGAAALLFFRRAQAPAAPVYVGTTTCATCHQDEYANWQRSDHRHAMEAADSTTVLGDFKDATFDYAGVHSRFTTEAGKYFVETDNAQGELQKFAVSYTFGHYPLQQYLIAFPDGRMQALSISWDSRPREAGGQRWFHLYPDERITHENPLHWTGAFQNWNSRCASCHSTNLVKNYSPETNRYDTQWQEVNVGCEACHGPGSQHVAWAKGKRSLANRGLSTDLHKVWEPHEGVVSIPQRNSSALPQQLQVCAGCHSRRSELQQPVVTRGYFDTYSLSPLLDGRYFPDGQMLEEVYVTGSFLQSRMHANHVTCTNCHEPHSGALRAAGNALCLQCHQSAKYQSEQHFFHKADSPGAQCVNCHMTAQTYMGVDVRRDHSFRVPDPQASARFGVPDPCTKCHQEKGDQWAAAFIAKRTGRKEPYYPQTALLAAARHNDASSSQGLTSYALDSARPAILRATALLESGRFPSPAQQQVAGELLASDDPLIRIGAVAAFANVDPMQRVARLQPVLNDPVKAVRMAAAQQLALVPLHSVPAELRTALGTLFEEYAQSLRYNADMPESLSNLALFQAAQGETAAAEKSLHSALKIAPRYLPAMLNLADTYRAQGHDNVGETLLRDAVATYPDSADAHHMLGLLLVRTRRMEQSVAELQQAARLAPDNARYVMIYALALLETGRRSEGVQVLQNAARRFPEDTQIQQALASARAARQ